MDSPSLSPTECPYGCIPVSLLCQLLLLARLVPFHSIRYLALSSRAVKSVFTFASSQTWSSIHSVAASTHHRSPWIMATNWTTVLSRPNKQHDNSNTIALHSAHSDPN